MKRILFAGVFALMLPGCSLVPSGKAGKIWWNPITWFSNSEANAADKAREKREAAADKLEDAKADARHAAHVEFEKTGLLLQQAPPSKPVDLAKRTTANGLALLDQERPLTASEMKEVRQLVADLLSDAADVAAKAQLKQQEAEGALGKVSDKLSDAQAKLQAREEAFTKASTELRQAFDRENALANQVRNFWFIIFGLAALWMVGVLLNAAAKIHPGIAGIAGAVNAVVSPTLAFAKSRAESGLKKLGEAITEARAKAPDVAERFVTFVDDHLDSDHKQVVKAAADTAPRSQTPP